MGPGLLKKALGKGGPAVTSGLGDLAVKSSPGKVEGGQRTEALPNFGIGLNFFENTRKYAQRGRI